MANASTACRAELNEKIANLRKRLEVAKHFRASNAARYEKELAALLALAA